MQRLTQHQITKIITKLGVIRDYYCEEHNTSHPNINLILEGHPNFDQSKFTIFNKRNGQVQKHQNRPLTTKTLPKEMICYD